MKPGLLALSLLAVACGGDDEFLPDAPVTADAPPTIDAPPGTPDAGTLANGEACALGTECTSTFCVDSFCCDMACAGECAACDGALTGAADGMCAPVTAGTDPDNDCGGTTCTAAGVCALQNGDTCASGAECASTFCTDSVCCDMACGGLCESCLGAVVGSGSDGTCGFVADMTDPENECPGQSCDGAGGCM
jgi:hypothetical protein